MAGHAEPVDGSVECNFGPLHIGLDLLFHKAFLRTFTRSLCTAHVNLIGPFRRLCDHNNLVVMHFHETTAGGIMEFLTLHIDNLHFSYAYIGK